MPRSGGEDGRICSILICSNNVKVEQQGVKLRSYFNRKQVVPDIKYSWEQMRKGGDRCSLCCEQGRLEHKKCHVCA